jgi:hypothetical protein
MNDASTATIGDDRVISATTSRRYDDGDGANGDAAIDMLHQMSSNRQAIRPLLDDDGE